MSEEALIPSTASDVAARLDALQATMSALEKQIGRAGREQFKANALAEAQAERLAAALDALRSADERRENDLSALRERSRTALADARLDVVRAMFPTLDGLDEALRSGQHILERHKRQAADTALLHQLLMISTETERQREATAWQSALEAWLLGLEFVRRRMLDAFAAEGVVWIEAIGRPFDPRRHVAVERVAANGVVPGTVVQEIRRGFMAGERVLRHAEVAVSAELKD